MRSVLSADTQRFPFDNVDGETFLIDSQRGHLFVFSGLGSWLWSRMSRGATLEEVITEVRLRFGEPAVEPTRSFLESLVQAEMLRPGAPTEVGAGNPPEVSPPESFVAPAIERFDQIADIISMDPIHEVDASKGWPHSPKDSV